LKRERPCAHRHAAAGHVDVERRVVGQRAQQVVQLARRHRGRDPGLRRSVGKRGDLHLEIGRRELERAVLRLDQHVREDRQRVPALDDAGDRLEGLQERVAGDLF
jgi:hypothetical protein